MSFGGDFSRLQSEDFDLAFDFAHGAAALRVALRNAAG